MAYEFKLPDLGEGVAEGEISRWLVEVGQEIHEDDPLVEVQTDKTTVEIPSPAEGKVARILVQEGELVPVGTPLVVIGDGELPEAPPSPPAERVKALIAELANPHFAKRNAAERELSAVGDVIAGELRDALTQNPPPETRKRLEAILAVMADSTPAQADTLRGVRAVRVVDHDRELLRRQVRGNPLVSVEDRVLQHPPIADGDPESVAHLSRRTRQALRQILDLLAR